MYISRVYIRNFRNFKEFDLYIPNGEPLTIIGGNNTGKTNLLKALRLVLDANMPPWEKQLETEDFSWSLGDSPWKKGEEIVITITLSSVKPGEESNEFIRAVTGLGAEKNETTFKADLSYVFAPEYKKKDSYSIYDYRYFLVAGKYHPSGYEYDEKGNRKDIPEIFDKHYKGICDVADFYKYFYVDSKRLEDIKNGKGEIKISKQISNGRIKRRVNTLYLDALRDVTKNFYEGYHSIVSQLIRNQIIDSEEESYEIYSELSEGFSKLRQNELVDKSSQSTTIEDGVTQKRKEPNGIVSKSKGVLDSIEVNLQDKKLNLLSGKANLKIGTPPLSDKNVSRYFNFLADVLNDGRDPGKENISIEELGLGYQNLAFISSIFALFELKKKINYPDSDEESRIFFNLLLIEEPEAHLDVQNQKHLHTQIENKTQAIQEASDSRAIAFTQVIQTSHSTHLTAKSKLENVMVLEKNKGNTIAINVDRAISENNADNYGHDRRIIRQYLDATKSAMLFARKVVLVEGPSEKFAIPTLLNLYLQEKEKTADELGIEVVEIGFKGYNSFYSLYGEDGKLQNKCLGITDGDWHVTEESPSGMFKLPGVTLQKTDSDKRNVRQIENIYTFEVDTFFIPNPEKPEQNNINWLKEILERFQREQKYYGEDTFKEKIAYIDSFLEHLKQEKLTNEKGEDYSIKSFFSKILYSGVTKPTISLYLASLIKAVCLGDEEERKGWDEERVADLKFIMPTHLYMGFDWLINDDDQG